jgi:glutathione S-transferase
MDQRELFFISGSPPCWTVMLALEMKGLPYEPRRLDNAKREQKSPEFLKVNARGQVPTLRSDGFVVSETLAVLAYLDAVEPNPPLFGTTPFQTADIWRTICEVDGNLRDPVGDISRPLFRGKAEEFAEKIQKAAAVVRQELAMLEVLLADGSWLADSEPSAADLIAFTVVMQLARAAGRDDAAFLELGICPLAEHFPNIDAWTKKVEALPGYENAFPPHWK